MDSRTLTTDENGTIENPALPTGVQIRRSWGGYVVRRGDRVTTIRHALLQRNNAGRFDVSHVPIGSHLGFGAKIKSDDDDAWQQIRSLYIVLERATESITLREVSEADIPCDATLPTLMSLSDDLNRIEAQVQSFKAALQRLLDQQQRP